MVNIIVEGKNSEILWGCYCNTVIYSLLPVN